MNKGELVEFVAAELGQTKANAAVVVEVVLAGITKGLQQDNGVTLSGFGTFTKKSRKARTGRNPVTGQPIEIKATRTVGFKPSQLLKTCM